MLEDRSREDSNEGQVTGYPLPLRDMFRDTTLLGDRLRDTTLTMGQFEEYPELSKGRGTRAKGQVKGYFPC